MEPRNLYHLLRHYLNKHSAAVTLSAIILMSWAAMDVVQQVRKPSEATLEVDAFYYDLDVDRLFISKDVNYPPIAGPGSRSPEELTAARAFVFACNDCNDPSDRYIGWVEGFSAEARERYQAAAKLSPSAPFAAIARTSTDTPGHLISTPDPKDPNWKSNFFEFGSPDGAAIIERALSRCGLQRPKSCKP